MCQELMDNIKSLRIEFEKPAFDAFVANAHLHAHVIASPRLADLETVLPRLGYLQVLELNYGTVGHVTDSTFIIQCLLSYNETLKTLRITRVPSVGAPAAHVFNPITTTPFRRSEILSPSDKDIERINRSLGIRGVLEVVAPAGGQETWVWQYNKDRWVGEAGLYWVALPADTPYFSPWDLDRASFICRGYRIMNWQTRLEMERNLGVASLWSDESMRTLGRAEMKEWMADEQTMNSEDD